MSYIWRKWNFKYAVHFNVVIFQYVRETSFRTIRGQDIYVIWFYAGSYYIVDVLVIQIFNLKIIVKTH